MGHTVVVWWKNVFLEAFHHNLSRYSISSSRPFIIAGAWYHCHHHPRNLFVIFPSLHCPSSTSKRQRTFVPPDQRWLFPTRKTSVPSTSSWTCRTFSGRTCFSLPRPRASHPSHRSQPIHLRSASARDLLFHSPSHWVRVLCRWLLDLAFALAESAYPVRFPLTLFRRDSTGSPLFRLPRCDMRLFAQLFDSPLERLRSLDT